LPAKKRQSCCQHRGHHSQYCNPLYYPVAFVRPPSISCTLRNCSQVLNREGNRTRVEPLISDGSRSFSASCSSRC
jgi:hypothetical protein